MLWGSVVAPRLARALPFGRASASADSREALDSLSDVQQLAGLPLAMAILASSSPLCLVLFVRFVSPFLAHFRPCIHSFYEAFTLVTRGF